MAYTNTKDEPKKNNIEKRKKQQNQPFEAVECEMCEHMNTL